MTKNSDSYYLENILSNIPEYIFWKDLNSVYVRCNLNFANLAGVDSINAIVGKTDYDLPWSQFTKEVYLQEDKLIIESKCPLPPKAVPLTGADGKQRVIRVSKAPFLDDKGKVVGILGVFHDITELSETQSALLEQMEKTEDAYRSKTEFLSIMTHEIRNPVGNIVMFDIFLKRHVEALKKLFEEVTDSQTQEITSKFHENFSKAIEGINVIAHEAEKALDYLKSLGEIHRLQTKGINTRFTLIKIENLINGIIRDSQPYNITNVEIKYTIDPSLPERVEIDYSNIYDALKVVASNALRFSNIDGKVNINVKDDKNRLEITVRDFGSGIAASQISDLFEDDKTYIRDPEDAMYRKPSLRLTLAKMMIEASGGELKIERAKNGTTVIIFVPYKITENNLKKIGDSKYMMDIDEERRAKKKISKRKVLVVEDDPIFQKAEKAILESLGHSVSVVSSGEEALKKLSKNTYDIVFLDITLPDISGVEVIKKVRKNNKDLRIIVVTSHANTTDTEHFEEMGATLVLTKPVSQRQFQSCLDFSEDEND